MLHHERSREGAVLAYLQPHRQRPMRSATSPAPSGLFIKYAMHACSKASSAGNEGVFEWPVQAAMLQADSACCHPQEWTCPVRRGKQQ